MKLGDKQVEKMDVQAGEKAEKAEAAKPEAKSAEPAKK